MNWRVVAALAVLACFGWVGFEIGRAGSDIRVQRLPEPGSLTGGKVVGKRLDGKSWSLDYDTRHDEPGQRDRDDRARA